VSAAKGKRTSWRKSRAKVKEEWQPPKSPPPDARLTNAYLADAREQIPPSDKKGRRRQLEARQDLLTLYREQLIEKERMTREAIKIDPSPDDQASWKRQQILERAHGVVDLQLRTFFEELSLLIWRSEDPVATLQTLLRGERTRGSPRGKNDYRDFLIAAKVAGRMLRGERRDDACAAVADKFRLSWHAVLNIYKRRDILETKAQLEWDRSRRG
jgi:hypothetical protein